MEESMMEQNDTLKKVIEFHGHMCPGIAYGYRAAQAALNAFGNRAVDEEIVAVVENDACSVDAIQVMTGCTFGKGNLIFKDLGKQAYTFYNRVTGEGLRISVEYKYDESPEDKALWERFSSGDRSPEVVKGIKELKARKTEAILSAEEEQVLKIRPVETPPPPRARLYPTARCEICGEKVMETRIREKEGKKLCIPCSE
jgi:formylmethanofuran dehydrogenase subunit E